MSHGYPTSESLWISVALHLVALVYLHRWLRVAWLAPDGVKGWRAWSFLAGMLLLWVALGSPLSLLDHDLLTVHMVQHVLLMTLAPPLILLGTPLELLLQLPRQRFVELIARPLRWTAVRHLGLMLLHPAVGLLAATATLLVWHIPGVFMLGLRSPMLHGIEQASFLVAGLLFWWPVVEPSRGASKWPDASILLYLLFATLPCDILSGFLVFCDRVVYPVYLSSPRRFSLSASEDQQCAGALMWTCVTLVYLVAAAFVTARLLSSQGSQEYTIRKSETPEIALRKSDVQRMEVV